MKNTVVLEKTDTGYSAYIPTLLGVAATEESISKVKEELKDALEFHLEGMREDGLGIPESFQGTYELEFQVDVKTLFEWFSGVMTKSGLARITNMNQSLVSQYANGLKDPSDKQLKKIENALHNFGHELLSINLAE